MIKYTIDDGTGMVDCTQWLTKQQQQSLLIPEVYQIGDVIKIRGKLKKVPMDHLDKYVCFSLRQVSIQTIVSVSPIHDEMYHRLKCIQLHENFYKDSGISVVSTSM